MTVLGEVLLEEYVRSRRVTRAIAAELAELPRGSVRERHVGEHTYYYLQYRDGSHVRSDYVPRADDDRVRSLVERRRELAAALKEQEKSRRQIERALSKDFIRRHTGE